ncbi:MAG TPA: helix-turn-helix domain-containing protein [Chloroflexia bacterium]|jgi:transcriptional regulator with XRE-family HTH domain
MTLGERLKQARLARNMSLTALARLSGLSKGFLSQVETGSTNPSLGSLQRLAQALSLSISDLVATEALRPPVTATSRPRHVRRVQPSRDKSSLTQVSSNSLGVMCIAHLLPGSYLDAAATTSRDDAYLMVLSGEAHFIQPGMSLKLAEGDSLTFSLSQPYRLSAHVRSRVSILLMVRSAGELPQVVEVAFRERLRVQAEGRVVKAEFQGPLRLVAMRAARVAERGRRG